MNKAPDISAFQYDKAVNGQIESNINLYRGAVCFAYHIVQLPVHDNVGISVSASYNSDIDKSLTLDNKEAPTGVMGLGWGLTYDMIECERSDIGKDPACRGYRLTNGDNPGGGSPLRLVDQKDGILFFENEAYDHSQILYDPQNESWTITDPHGTKRIFGGNYCLQYAVVCDGKYTKRVSSKGSGLKRRVKAWNLSEIRSPGGFFVKYEYDLEEQPVGKEDAMTYTKAAYIHMVSDAFGNRAKFVYREKEWSKNEREPREYGDLSTDPHSQKINYEQLEYETKYLSEIAVYKNESYLYSTVFEYQLENFADTAVVTGDTVKRLLTSVKVKTKTDELPDMQFEYCGSSEVNPGALKRVCYPEGGNAEYRYSRIESLPISSRTLRVSNHGYAEPAKTYFGSDYVVILQKSTGKAAVSIYQWIGRWQKYTPEEALEDIDPETIKVYANDTYVVIAGTTADELRTKYLIMTKRRKIKGGWQTSAVETIESPSVEIITGDEWLLMQDTDNGELLYHCYKPPYETWEKSHFPEKPEDGYIWRMAAYGNRLFCFCYDEDGAGENNIVKVFQRHPLNGWELLAQREAPDFIIQGGADGTCHLAFDGCFAAGTFVRSTTESALRYSLGIWRLDPDDQLHNDVDEECSVPVGDDSCIAAQIAGNTVIAAGYLYQYCGDQWITNEQLGIRAPGQYQFALAEDVALSSMIDGKHNRIRAAVFDAEANDWIVHDLSMQQVSDIPGFGVSICGELAVCGGKVYDIRARTFDKVIENLGHDYGTGWLFNNGCCIAGPIYELSGDQYRPCRSFIHTFKNGQLVDADVVSSVFDENCSGSGDIFSLCMGDSDVALLFAGGGRPDKPVEFYQATEVRLDDGIDPVIRYYQYDPLQVACDASGQYTCYGSVEVTNAEAGAAARSVYQYADSVGSSFASENMTASSIADGTLVSVDTYVDGKLDQRFMADYVFTDQVDGQKIYGSVLSRGVLTQLRDIDKDGRGIEDITEFQADVLSGQYKELTYYNYNLQGEKETYRQSVKFAYEVYPEMKQQHRYTAIYESSLTVNDQLVSKEEKRYENIDGLFAEKSAQVIDPAGIRNKTLYEITGRGRFGEITGKKGRFPEYFTFDRSGCCRVAEFTNSAFGEGFAYCFEDYEEPLYVPAEGAELTDQICYAGTKCLEVKPGCQSDRIVHEFVSTGAHYGFSFFAQCKQECKLQITANGISMTRAIPGGEFGYQLVDLEELQLAAGEHVRLEIRFENCSEDSLFIDILAFFSILNPPRIQVYYAEGALLAAVLEGYGDITEPIYDDKGRIVCIVENKKTMEMEVPSMKRETGEMVNATIRIKNAGEGTYLNQIDRGQWFSPGLCLHDDFCGMFFCQSDLDIKLCDKILLSRRNERWILEDRQNDEYQEAVASGKLITILVSDMLMLAVDGKIIFSYKRKEKGKAAFAVCGVWDEITDFMIGNDPVASVAFSDGAGKLRQEHSCQGGKIVVSATGYDALGREAYTTVPTYVEDRGLRFIPDYVAGIDRATGRMTGLVSEENPKCEGYPYYSTVYETRDGGRVIESGLPGAEFAVNHAVDVDKRHTVRTAYSQDTGRIDLPKTLTGLPYYSVVTVRDPDENEMVTVYDLQKNKIAEAVTAGGQQLLTTYLYEYKNARRTVTVTMPNGNVRVSQYDLSGNLLRSSDANAGEVTYFYDGRDNLRFVKDSDTEKTGYCKYCKYDALYRIIEEGLCPVLSDEELYQKAEDGSYPKEGRIISKRYDYDGDFSLTEIGALTKTEIFDETTNNQVINSVAVLADKTKNQLTKTVTTEDEQYKIVTVYDNFGNMICESGTDGERIDYRYHGMLQPEAIVKNGKEVTRIDHRADGLPKTVVTCGQAVEYGYDARGNVTSIDSPLYREAVCYLKDGKYYNGKIRSVESEIKGIKEGHPAKVKYDLEYDSAGRLAAAVCEGIPEFSLTDIAYDANGNILSCNGEGRSRKFELTKDTDKVQAADDVQYQYNALGAVTSIDSGGRSVAIDYYPYSGLPRRFEAGDMTVDLQYDDDGKRLRKIVSQNGEQHVNTYFHHGSNVSEEIRDDKRLKYIYGKTGLNAVSCGGTDYAVITDRLGYARVVAECEKIIQAYHYKPFGEAVAVIHDSELVNLLFGGYELDRETGLYNAGARLYDPGSYRFLSPDPNGEFASPYLFCGNDPFALIDEEGELSWYAALIGTVVGIVLTIGLSVLTMGAAAPVSAAVLGTQTAAAGAAGTAASAAAGTASAAGKLAYNMAMGFTVAAASGLAAEGVKAAIDGEPFTVASVYNTLLNATVSGLVFGGAGTLLDGMGKAAAGTNLLGRLKGYAAHGAALSLINAGVAAAASPVSDVINGEEVSGLNALENAGFAALSGSLSCFATRFSGMRSLKLGKGIGRKLVSDTIGSVFDPGKYYGEITEVADASCAEKVYDGYSVGPVTYVEARNRSENVQIKGGQAVRAFACFGSSNPSGRRPNAASGNAAFGNAVSPRFFSTRGIGQRLL